MISASSSLLKYYNCYSHCTHEGGYFVLIIMTIYFQRSERLICHVLMGIFLSDDTEFLLNYRRNHKNTEENDNFHRDLIRNTSDKFWKFGSECQKVSQHSPSIKHASKVSQGTAQLLAGPLTWRAAERPSPAPRGWWSAPSRRIPGQEKTPSQLTPANIQLTSEIGSHGKWNKNTHGSMVHTIPTFITSPRFSSYGLYEDKCFNAYEMLLQYIIFFAASTLSVTQKKKHHSWHTD